MSPAILIYDGACPMCLRARDWFARRVDAERLRFVPCQSGDRSIVAPMVSEADCMEAMQLVLPGGAVLAGEAALPSLLRMTRWWGWLARPLELRLSRRVSPVLYRWIARNRLALSGILVRKTPGARCRVDGDCE